jgi:hypothetical protein
LSSSRSCQLCPEISNILIGRVPLRDGAAYLTQYLAKRVPKEE